MRTIYLSEAERELLFRQPPGTAGDGGFQGFLVGLQRRTDAASGRLDLTPGISSGSRATRSIISAAGGKTG